MKTRIYKDDYGNTARIEPLEMYPYRGAPKKEKSFRLWVTSDFESVVYFVSIYESLTAAKYKLNTFSCGTFKEV